MSFSQNDKGGSAKLEALRKSLMDDCENPDSLLAFFNQAVADGEDARAIAVFDQLLRQHPWNQDVRKLHIALNLRHKNYPAAMESVETLVAFSAPDDAMIDSALAVRKHLGPRTIAMRPDAGPTLSLCMIVKNERAFLGPCLNAIKTLVDEIILVDTGSTDRSGDIARIYGACVYDFDWCDDFAAARNVSLAKAHGDWILILDADEIIASRDHEVLKRIVEAPVSTKQAYSFQTRNYSNLANNLDWRANDGGYPRHETGLGWFPTDKVRLFPRSDGIQFVYPVHELVDPSILAAGLTIVQCPVPIHHYGHVNETKNLRKARHYFDLGYAKLAQLGNNGVAIRELAIQAGQLGKWTEAIELWHRFLDIYRDHAEAYANIAGAYWQTGRYELGVAYSKKAIRANPELKEGHYNLAINFLMTRQPEKAAAILQSLLQKNRNYLAAEFMLAAVLDIAGDRKGSLSVYRTLEKKVPKAVLAMAIQDIGKKLIESGLTDYAKLMDKKLK